MAGRVFKEEESLTLWVSADENKIPLKIKADLAVGSLRADLIEYKSLKHYFPIQFD
jgi:imidazolonepropionase-like amidohydrolase